MPTDVELAWLAGLFEGEGSLSQVQHDKTWTLSIGMTDEDIIRRAAAIGGVGNIGGPYAQKNPEHKPYWYWKVCVQTDIEMLVRLLMPMMGQRRCQKMQQFLDDRATKAPRVKMTDDVAASVRASVLAGKSVAQAARDAKTNYSAAYRVVNPRTTSAV